MSSPINRQDAIDAMYKVFSYAYCDNCEKGMDEDLCGDCHRKYQNWSASKKVIEDTLNNLPSAQPEIVRCKDCRWGRKTCGYIKCSIDSNIPTGYHGYDWFCPNGERRTDE